MNVILFLGCVSVVDASTLLDHIRAHATLVHGAIRQLTSVKVSSPFNFVMSRWKKSCPKDGSDLGSGTVLRRKLSAKRDPQARRCRSVYMAKSRYRNWSLCNWLYSPVLVAMKLMKLMKVNFTRKNYMQCAVKINKICREQAALNRKFHSMISHITDYNKHWFCWSGDNFAEIHSSLKCRLIC